MFANSTPVIHFVNGALVPVGQAIRAALQVYVHCVARTLGLAVVVVGDPDAVGAGYVWFGSTAGNTEHALVAVRDAVTAAHTTAAHAACHAIAEAHGTVVRLGIAALAVPFTFVIFCLKYCLTIKL